MPDLWIFILGSLIFLVTMYAMMLIGRQEAQDPAHSVPPADRQNRRTQRVAEKTD